MFARSLHRTSAVAHRCRLAITLVMVLAIVAAACAPAAPPPAPTTAPAPVATAAPAVAPTTAPAAAATAAPAASAGQVLKVVLGGELTTVDPTIDTTKTSIVIDNTMLEPLAMSTPDQKFKPWLAESWEPVAPTKWRLKLKKGVKFHNGEPFNADSVAYSVNLFLTTKGFARGYFAHIAGSEKVDENTVDIITKEPSAILPASLGFLYVFPPKYYAEQGPDNFGKKPIGTGPFKLAEWTKGVQMRVVANPDYWGKKPTVSEIQFRWAPEASSRVALLETGEVHLAQNILPALVERVEKSTTARIETIKSIRKVFMMINIYKEPTKDARVRKALNHAIDVESIIKTLFKGRAYGRDRGVNYEGFEGYQFDKLEPYQYDPELAKKLLAEAGYANGFEIPLWHTMGRYMLDKEASEAMAGQLAKVGIKITLQGMESGAFFTKTASEVVPGLTYFSCGPLFMTPIYCTVVHFQSGGANAYGAIDRTDAYIKEARGTLDDAKRVKIFQEFENWLYKEHVPWVWLWHQQDIYGVSNKLNWKPRSDELLAFDEATFK